MNKMLEKLDNVVFSNYIDLDIITYFIDVIYLININLDDDSFDEDDLANIVLIRPDVIDLNNVKYVKKKIDKELIPIAWYPTRVWDWCMTKDEKLWNDKSNA